MLSKNPGDNFGVFFCHNRRKQKRRRGLGEFLRPRLGILLSRVLSGKILPKTQDFFEPRFKISFAARRKLSIDIRYQYSSPRAPVSAFPLAVRRKPNISIRCQRLKSWYNDSMKFKWLFGILAILIILPTLTFAAHTSPTRTCGVPSGRPARGSVVAGGFRQRDGHWQYCRQHRPQNPGWLSKPVRPYRRGHPGSVFHEIGVGI